MVGPFLFFYRLNDSSDPDAADPHTQGGVIKSLGPSGPDSSAPLQGPYRALVEAL